MKRWMMFLTIIPTYGLILLFLILHFVNSFRKTLNKKVFYIFLVILVIIMFFNYFTYMFILELMHLDINVLNYMYFLLINGIISNIIFYLVSQKMFFLTEEKAFNDYETTRKTP